MTENEPTISPTPDKQGNDSNETWKKILFSLAVSGGVSLIISLVGMYYIGHFWLFFIVAFFAQYLVFYLYNLYIERWTQVQLARIRKEEIADMLQQSVEVECPFCDEINIVPFFVSEERNEFTCTACDQKSCITHEIKVARVTKPINIDKLNLE